MTTKVFEIEGFGRVGYSNLIQSGFVVTVGKQLDDLEVNESTNGISVMEPERKGKSAMMEVKRLPDQTAI